MLDDFLLEVKRLKNLATEYAKLLIHSGTPYSGIEIYTETKTFGFCVGPSTHGLTRRVKLPLNVRKEDLQKLAEEQKIKWAEELKKNTCDRCGHVKFLGDYPFY